MSLVWIGIKAFYYIYFLKIILINNQINTFKTLTNLELKSLKRRENSLAIL